jgi:hypothetical protein
MAHWLPVEIDHPFVGTCEAGYDSKQRCLAAAAGSEEGKKLSSPDMKVDATKHPQLAISFADFFKSYLRGLHR